MLDALIPFHQQAEDVGAFLIEDRARDAEQDLADAPEDGPSENVD
jgi:hypothetical protein